MMASGWHHPSNRQAPLTPMCHLHTVNEGPGRFVVLTCPHTLYWRYMCGTAVILGNIGSRTDLPTKSIIPASARPFMPRKDKSNRFPLNVVMTGPGRCRNAYRARYGFCSKSGLMARPLPLVMIVSRPLLNAPCVFVLITSLAHHRDCKIAGLYKPQRKDKADVVWVEYVRLVERFT